MGETGTTAIIPARLHSSRLPGKPLADICGKPMVLRVVERVKKIKSIGRTVVATDSREIFDTVKKHGFEAVMTDSAHTSGTDRLAEAAEILALEPEEIVVNVQGDQPLVEPETVEAVLNALLRSDSAVMATAACPMSREEARDPNRVKVVLDCSGNALYFSRSLIPFDRDGILRNESKPYLRHIGIYAYPVNFLQKFVKMAPGRLESIEKLEQLRVIENGFDIAVKILKAAPVDVDTRDDLKAVRKIFGKSLRS
ncbi:MAG: 3-deoxy-manno-octulosonate cytidylyltransferase [Thermodesulfatator sp.]|nr:MAG: 3-deoxy-manno-octulosonate cytidylyltransferase [Thermodesulfatator sp.]